MGFQHIGNHINTAWLIPPTEERIFGSRQLKLYQIISVSFTVRNLLFKEKLRVQTHKQRFQVIPGSKAQ